MPFLGFVAFVPESAREARAAVSQWLDANAVSRVSRGAMAAAEVDFHAYALAGRNPHASIVQHDTVMFLGDVDPSWLQAPDKSGLESAALADPAPAGMPDTEFAFAVWSTVRTALTLYRCPFGCRALYYVAEPGAWLAFSSLPEPLLAIPGVAGAIDELGLAAYLVPASDVSVPPEATAFARLKRLPAAHRLRASPEGIELRRYWQLPDAPIVKAGADDPAVPREMRRLLASAVERRLRDGSRIGVELSGGLDSSAILALADARRAPTSRLFSYSLRPHEADGTLSDPHEAELATLLLATRPHVQARVVAHGKAARPFYLCDPAFLARPLPEFVFLLGNEHRLFDAAADDGCDVLLTGWGGDQMVSARGGLQLLAMIRGGRWRAAGANLAAGGAGRMLRRVRHDILGPLWSHLTARRWPRPIETQLLSVLRSPGLAAAVRRAARRRDGVDFRRRRRAMLSRRSLQVGLELQDWVAQRAGLVVRHPLLDRTLVEFCDRLPPEWSVHLGVTRRAFRESVSDLLPAAAADRRKAPLPFVATERREYWTLHLDALRALARADSPVKEYVDLPRLVDLHERSAWPLDEEARPIWQLGAGLLVTDRLLRPGALDT